MKKTVGIIGAGIGGLMAGAFLAKEGWQVTVYEKAVTVGGSAGTYARKNRRFPTGATIAFGLEDRGLLDTLFQQLDIRISSDVLDHPMDVILEDRTISLYREPSLWKAELVRAFPERSDDVLDFWHELEQLSEAVFGVTATGVSLPIRRMVDLGKLPRHAVSHPGSMVRLARNSLRTVEDLLRVHHLETYEPFRQFLDAQLLDAAQIDCTKAALLPSSLALTIYRRGSFYVDKGIGQLSEALAERIKELGGDVRTASPVEILILEEKKWRIVTKRRSELFDTVINNSGVSFGEGTSHAEAEDFSWGAFRIDALLKETFRHSVLDGRPLPFAAQIVPDKKQTVLYTDGHGPVYVTFQPAYNRKNERIEDELMMTCSIHTQSEQWKSLSQETYLQKKKRVKEAMFEEIQRVFPVQKYISSSEAGTPVTYEKYLGKTEVGGFPLTVRNAILKPKSVHSSLSNFYIVGEQSFPGPGTLSSALSGYHAARAIMKDRK
ncbi:phytoene desaturase family protein [Sporosarcina aquimarina]|uniref:NAD(P)/FAD-dependent oxidoreductase n=1 Tax=Sporosarcina aquimarina TaxID=114975 RepID=A0ABU4G3E8_9BACL|nr:NAD(P)/FAD-dependent oxidoreductase [Sporosarcina aquimarina]MDW0111501.1 NAD(P)/FAD-dependent oxidoreductase [Sporosarcina aquimarina]